MKWGEQARDTLVVAWLLLVAVGFWGPYLAVILPANLAHALYAVFLIVAVGFAVRSLVGGRTSSGS